MATTRTQEETREPIVTTIVADVASCLGTEPTTLPPLQRTIDVDALEAVARSDSIEVLSFRYNGCRVTIDGGGVVEVDLLDPPTDDDSTEHTASEGV